MPADRPEDVLAETAGVSSPRTPVVIRLLMLATFVVILNETIMLNAIPRLTAELHVTEQAAQWVSTGFMLTTAAVIPVTGWFLQRVSTRSAYATAMGVFLAGTALSAAAPVFEMLLLGRIVQAVGTAVMLPLLMTTLMTVVPESDRGRVMGNVTLAISVAPAMGPTVSGLVLAHGSWRMLFLLVLPIAGAVTWFGLRRLENVGEPEDSTIDWPSVVMAAVGFGGLVYGLTQFAEGGAGESALVVGGGLVAVGAFVMRQLRLKRAGSSPLMDLGTLRHLTYTKGVTLMSAGFVAMMGSMILLPLYLQNVRGLSPLQTGLLVMPGGLAMGVLGPTVGRVFDRFGGRMLIIPGSVGIVAALAGFTQVSMAMPYWQVLGLYMILMLSLATVFTPVFTLALGALPQHLYSHGSSMLGTLQQVSAAFGTALAVTVMTVRADQLTAGGASVGPAQLGGMRLAFLVSAALSIVVVAVALRMPKRADDSEEAAPADPQQSPPTGERDELEPVR
ncbi:MDR family MFS transporter [Actinopolymorpha sp. NPDC004070]|uniref:MDR family MFS transporter n=1 Tax=Actinopolymorpha sp. NPDC004070 TaxID=3154548 RepID=UPI0033A28731